MRPAQKRQANTDPTLKQEQNSSINETLFIFGVHTKTKSISTARAEFSHGEPLRLVYSMIIVPSLDTMPAPHTFRSSFGHPAESTVWPIRRWDGETYSFGHPAESTVWPIRRWDGETSSNTYNSTHISISQKSQDMDTYESGIS